MKLDTIVQKERESSIYSAKECPLMDNEQSKDEIYLNPDLNVN